MFGKSSLFVTLLISLMASTASFAAATFTPNVALRTDYQINKSDDNTVRSDGYRMKENKELESKNFKVHTAIFNAEGSLEEKMRYYFAWNLATIYEISTAAGPNLQKLNFLDSFYELAGEYKIVEPLTLKFGKYFTLAGGIEGSQKYEDFYFTTLAGSGLGSVDYKVGAALAYAIADQTFTAALFEGDKGIANQDGPGMGVVWSGSFLDGMIAPMASYHYLKTPKQVDGGLSGLVAAPEKKKSYWAIGSAFNLFDKQLIVNADFLKNVYKSETTENKKDSDQSYYIEMKYNHGGSYFVRPVAKYEISKSKLEDANNFNRNAYAIILEFFPRFKAADKKETPRFHIGYISSTDKYKRDVPATATNGDIANGKKIETSQWLAGFTLNI
ncbi:MAG: hypothetical protein HQK52_10805 [Oligoflexia bacterium]|nr:hypothetical protein [Oligoflexia bacterium]